MPVNVAKCNTFWSVVNCYHFLLYFCTANIHPVIIAYIFKAMGQESTIEWDDLKNRFHKLTDSRDFATAPMEEMHSYTIHFGKTYKGITYQSVYDTKPQYIAWLLDRAGSPAGKTPGQLNFLHYIKLRIMDAESKKTEETKETKETKPRQQIPAWQSAAEPNSAKFVAEKPSAFSATEEDFEDYEELGSPSGPAEGGLIWLTQKVQNLELGLSLRLERLEKASTMIGAARAQ